MDPLLVFGATVACIIVWNVLVIRRGWPSVTALTLLERGAVLVDVGTDSEFALSHIDGATHLPLEKIAAAEELAPYRSPSFGLGAPDRPVIVYSRTRARSSEAARRLRAVGYCSVLDFGTMDRWP